MLESQEIISMETKRKLTSKYMAMPLVSKLEFWKARKKDLESALAKIVECINHYPHETSGLLIARGHILAELNKVENHIEGIKEAITPTKRKEG